MLFPFFKHAPFIAPREEAQAPLRGESPTLSVLSTYKLFSSLQHKHGDPQGKGRQTISITNMCLVTVFTEPLLSNLIKD